MASSRRPERLHVVSTPITQEGRSYDIVLVHGLGGHFERSWTHRNGYSWPLRALAPRYPNSRIVSIECPGMLRNLASFPFDVAGFVVDLIRDRTKNSRSESPIILVAHSVGGILAKQLYISTHPHRTRDSEYHSINAHIQGFVFFGTPHQDIAQPDIKAVWRALEQDSIVSLRGYSEHLEQALGTISRVNAEFRELAGEDVPNICFYEQETMLIGSNKGFLVTKVEACPGSPPVDLAPLELRHQHLSRFTKDEDENLQRVMAGFTKLVLMLNDELILRPEGPKKRPLMLLSLDGGGVKGLFTVLILRKLLEETVHLQDPEDDRRLPCDYFDLIAGTSTGGLLAIMLSRLRMDIAACLQTYRELSRQIFRQPPWFTFTKWPQALLGTSWYSGQALEDAFCSAIRENMSTAERATLRTGKLSERDLKLVSSNFQKSRCFVCAVREDRHKVERLRSYLPDNGVDHEGVAHRLRIWEAARATSAAPLYFPPIQIQGTTYFDGGMDSNNPVIEVIEEARKEFPNQKIEVIVSIGTGRCRPVEPRPPLQNVVLSFISRATNTEAQHQRLLDESAFDDVRAGYFRFQGAFDLGDIDLADSDKLEDIEKLADIYLQSEAGRNTIAGCAARLARRWN